MRYDHDDDRCREEDCEGCEDCTEEVSTTKTVVARKARGSILPGDLITVTSGFEYRVNGPRLGYFRRTYLAGYGPGHGPEKVGLGPSGHRRWGLKAVFAKAHPTWVDHVAAREAVVDEAARVANEERTRLAAEERARLKAERTALVLATEGDVINYDGGEWVAGPTWSKAHYFSNAEYYGHACDAEVRTYRKLTAVGTGEARTVRF